MEHQQVVHVFSKHGCLRYALVHKTLHVYLCAACKIPCLDKPRNLFNICIMRIPLGWCVLFGLSISLISCENPCLEEETHIKSLEMELQQALKTNQYLQGYIDWEKRGEEGSYPTVEDHLADSTIKQYLRQLESELPTDVQALYRDEKYLLRVGERLLFASGEYKLSEEGKKAIATLGKTIDQFPLWEVQVIGHTDNQQLTPGGKVRDNWDLSAMRATEVARGLIQQGVDPFRIRTIGRGAFDPIDDNTQEAGRYRNRRTDIILVPFEVPLGE